MLYASFFYLISPLYFLPARGYYFNINETIMSKNKNGKDSGAGRPFKMHRWVEKLKEVLLKEDTTFLHDEDLIFLVNMELEENEQITPRTFMNWKAGKFTPDEQIGKEFMEILKYCKIKQKQFLMAKIIEPNDKNWYRFAWIAERRFEELNLKKITETNIKNEQTAIIQIMAANDEQSKLIDSIINPEFDAFKIVEPKRIPNQKDVELPTDNENEDDVPF